MRDPAEETTAMPSQVKTDASVPTVCIVDRDSSVRDSLRVLVGTLGVNVRVFPSAEAFLSGYDIPPGTCVVTEVDLPGISGLELQERLCELDSPPPVILLTSRSNVQIAVRAMRSGAVDFLEKPFIERVLLSSIRQALNLDAHLTLEGKAGV
jgi:FixJ family two-component response regulator